MNVINYCPNCKSKKIIKSPSVIMPFISYRLFGWMPLEINPKKKLRTLNNGTWLWHSRFPVNMIRQHYIYKSFFQSN